MQLKLWTKKKKKTKTDTSTTKVQRIDERKMVLSEVIMGYNEIRRNKNVINTFHFLVLFNFWYFVWIWDVKSVKQDAVWNSIEETCQRFYG